MTQKFQVETEADSVVSSELAAAGVQEQQEPRSGRDFGDVAKILAIAGPIYLHI